MWDLQQNTSPVARVVLTATGTTMIQILQDGKRLLDNFVRTLALDIDNKTNTARIVLKVRIIEPLFMRNARSCHKVTPFRLGSGCDLRSAPTA